MDWVPPLGFAQCQFHALRCIQLVEAFKDELRA
jgi:hypothetical protein